MTENFRAYIAILVLVVPAFLLLRVPLTAHLIAPADYRRRALLWLLITSFLFLSYNFWLFLLLAAISIVVAARKDSDPLGLYFFVLLAAPPFQSAISGFAGINRFLDLDHLRLLSLVVLLPVSLKLLTRPDTPGLFRLPTDKYVFGYLALVLALQAPTTTSTDVLRMILSTVIDAVLPYYAFSRGLPNLHRMRHCFASYVGIGVVVAVIGLFETTKGWLLYSALPNFLDVRWGYGGYMARGDSLRASVSTGHSIVLGYVLTVALGLNLALRSWFPTNRSWWIVTLLLCAGIGASFSRGPWVGAAAMLMVALLMGPSPVARLGKVGALAVVVLPALMFTPFGPKIISLLPFVGDYDAGSVDYRQQLFNVSWQVLMQNPMLGSPYYMYDAAMQELRQGEGIIDMVNTYMGIALASGFVGLVLFCSVFGSTAIRMFAYLVASTDRSSEDHAVGRALLATLAGILTTIATVGSVNAVPVVYWCVAGACAAYVRFMQVQGSAVEHARPHGGSAFRAAHP
ncbi:MAG TPA: O-antigen ligase family protein [Caldimonas sp.]|jgi:hypothetical protein|nr:O-antigen ligase family protein [Caldimonas sp.]HEX2542193.1 O-antigen ligase family protein [Caldimonas sp.]